MEYIKLHTFRCFEISNMEIVGKGMNSYWNIIKDRASNLLSKGFVHKGSETKSYGYCEVIIDNGDELLNVLT